MKLWATRDKGKDAVELWWKEPENSPPRSIPLWMGCFFCEFEPWAFKKLYGRLPRRDRPMQVTLTGRVPK